LEKAMQQREHNGVENKRPAPPADCVATDHLFGQPEVNRSLLPLATCAGSEVNQANSLISRSDSSTLLSLHFSNNPGYDSQRKD
jgi:hypothetical protein